MAVPKVARSAAEQVAGILESPEVAAFVAELDELRWTGRRGYGPRTLVGACLVKALYALPTWTRTVRLIAEHHALADAIDGTPSEWACYRFTAKLRQHSDKLAACLDNIAASLTDCLPDMGRDIAIDSTNLPAYANGHRSVSKNGPLRKHFSDPDASWGHRSAVSNTNAGSFYGFKLHAAVCARTGLPLAWHVDTGKTHDARVAFPLLESVQRRGFAAETAAMDKAYYSEPLYGAFQSKGCVAIVPQIRHHKVPKLNDIPVCEHGVWTFAGGDFKRKATKWRCPTGECQPKSTWLKASKRNPLIPRNTKRWGELYRCRGAVEREFGVLKHQFGLTPLRVRGLRRVRLHADLVMLARLSQALARARAMPLAA